LVDFALRLELDDLSSAQPTILGDVIQRTQVPSRK
jgi:hypothetical protein